ncbi:MAG: TrmJ/YjtD family RNA methyltransferase [Methanobacteriaceae archaeon]|nr:TrmJ/YjtD family RNA methyltransferase [Methanobacteriaceae archaeon]
MTVYIVFIEPETPGNIGFLARTMKNFGMKELVLINPCELEDSAYYQAMHAKELVQNAQIYNDINQFLSENKITQIIGTSGISGGSYNVPRIAITPHELGNNIQVNENIAILFGREGDGLTNEEISLCDVLVSIPTNKEYPIMNITHAAAVILYEIYVNNQEEDINRAEIEEATYIQKQEIKEDLNKLVGQLEYPPHKEKLAHTVTQRILGRAFISGREAHIIRGTIKRTLKRIK